MKKVVASFCVTILGLTAAPFGQTKDFFTVSAEQLSMTLDLDRKGGIVSLRNGDVDVVSPDIAEPTSFLIHLVLAKEERTFSSLDFERFSYEKIGGGVRLTYSGLEGKAVNVQLTWRAAGPYIAMTQKVRCGLQSVCSDIVSPYVNGYESLSGEATEDRFLLPWSAGKVYHDPARTLREDDLRLFVGTGYPGTMSMQLHAFYNSAGGIVMYAADPESHPKLFGLYRNKGTDTIGWGIRHYFDETPGFGFGPSYEVRVQACGPSWYDAADVYADWSRQQQWMKKKVRRAAWIKKMPIVANVHDNYHYTRMLPSWFARHQPSLNTLLGNRAIVNDLQQWEHYGYWVAPESFPPLGGEESMLEATKTVRGWGNHIKHQFSSGQFWLHKDVTPEVFETRIKKMAVMRRGGEVPTERFPNIGPYVFTCPTSVDYQDQLVHYVKKLADYRHDFISMDIWPISHPHRCHNPAHDHAPGLGRWWVDATIEMVQRMHGAVTAKEPEAIFGGEGMAEPYMPWMQVTLMRTTLSPVRRSRTGKIEWVYVPMYDYIYGDQVLTWGVWVQSQLSNARADLSLQFARGEVLHISDKWHHKYFDIEKIGINPKRKAEDPVPQPVLKVELGPPSVREANFSFAAKLNDFQQGPYNIYFSRGRGGRYPDVWRKVSSGWIKLEVYDRDPGFALLRHPTSARFVWAVANGSESARTIRVHMKAGTRVVSKSLRSRLTEVMHENRPCLELSLAALEVGVVEWE